MIYKCTNCHGALEYNPVTDKMECAFCGSSYAIGELSEQEEKTDIFEMEGVSPDDMKGQGTVEVIMEQDSVKMPFRTVENTNETGDDAENIKSIEEEIRSKGETMTCRIYTCKTCGAQLMINDVEASTYCAYCGQPTIVFERVSEERKPEYIIPFRISKEQVETAIREQTKGNFFVPKEVRNFSIEKIRGIYVPFWSFDIDYYDDQTWEYTTEDKYGNRKSTYYLREAESRMEGILVDASANLHDETTERLEPYDLRCKKPFTPEYLSGYYADTYDVEESRLLRSASVRAMNLFNEEIRKTIPKQGARKIMSRPKKTVLNADYVLLPAWFLTFRYHYEPYTMVINGQSGKIVGTLPFDKKKVIAMFVVLAIVFTFIFGAILMAVAQDIGVFVPGFILVPCLIGALSATGVKVLYNGMKTTLELTKQRMTSFFVRERQDK